MKANSIFCLLALVANFFPATSQTINFQHSGGTLDKHSYQKLVVNPDEVLLATVDSLYIDTLILNDGSTIRFQHNSMLIVENAFVAKHCTLTTSGADADALGGSGTNGNSLIAILIFRKLEYLIIDTRGGNGADGFRGRDGKDGMNGGGVEPDRGQNGEPGTPGGDGGNAGNLKLFYSCDGFVPTFSGVGKHRIDVFFTGGKQGAGGPGGAGGRGGQLTINPGTTGIGKRGTNGMAGKQGNRGADGQFTLEQMN